MFAGAGGDRRERPRLASKPEFVVEAHNAWAQEGQRAVLEASATGSPMPTFKWSVHLYSTPRYSTYIYSTRRVNTIPAKNSLGETSKHLRKSQKLHTKDLGSCCLSMAHRDPLLTDLFLGNFAIFRTKYFCS